MLNPGFENYDGPRTSVDDLNKCHHWEQINSADLLNSEVTSKNKGRLESYSIIPYQPRSGKCYAGLRFQRGYKEFMMGRLKFHLKKDTLYQLTAYIKISSKSSHRIKSLGIAFAHHMPTKKELLEHRGHAKYEDPRGIEIPMPWKRIQMKYTATGQEKFIAIGNFSEDINTELIDRETESLAKENIQDWADAYYYIDDLKLVALPAENPTSSSIKVKFDTPIVLDNIEFESGKAELLPFSYRSLDKLVEILKEKKDVSIQILGHTDNKGTEQSNVLLSKARANTVAAYLGSKGIEFSRLSSEGKGSSEPIAPNDSDSGRQKNRRVEVLLTH